MDKKKRNREYQREWRLKNKNYDKEYRKNYRKNGPRKSRSKTITHLEYFNSEQEYKERLLKFILNGELNRVILRGLKAYYENLPQTYKHDYKTICIRWNVELDDNRFFIFHKE